ncbi:MAG: xanthine dehydrogenase family protein molybdopterin-binding subunit [Beijerinckiaceae bacterium]|nr:xanthine dehydrogenase family protein molybdopterin-binding subunit [Beijerinckiaceae bacterium]
MNNTASSGPYVGRSQARIEGPLKVTGQARYVAEHVSDLYPDLHQAVVVGATIASGRVALIDTAAAEAMPGVVKVYTHLNAPKLTPVPIFPLGPAGEGRPPLQDDRVDYGGQAVALVVARTPEEAQAAADAIKVTYDATPAHTTWELLSGEVQGAPLPPPLAARFDLNRGDVGVALKSAAIVIETTADTPGHSQSAMELAATIAAPDGAGGLIVHDSTQWILGCRNMLSRQLGLPLDHIRVVAPFVGGGFGSKCFTWPHAVMAAFAALDLKVPVRLVLSRAQMHLSTGCRPAAHQTITLGAALDGRLTAVRQHAISQTSIGDIFVRAVGEVSEVLYALPNLETRNTVLRVNTTTPTNMRAPGESYGSFALETAMDMLAEKAGIDPVELRLRNLPEKHPENGAPFSTNALKQCLEEGAEAFGWAKRPFAPGLMKDGKELVGWGMAAACYGAYRSQAAVRATAFHDGTVEVASATHEIGSGTTTLMAQVAADVLGIDITRIRVTLGDTDLPAAPVHGASRNAGTIGPAVEVAALALKAELDALGADWAAALATSDRDSLTVTRRAGPPELDDKAFATLASGINTIRMPTTETAAMYAYAAHFCEVRIRPDLGRLRVTRMLSRCDIGRVLNPMQARSQILGGLVFGLGMALSEQIVPDFGTGRVLSAGITEYWLPGMPMMPEFDIGFVGPPDYVSNELGAKGAGEIGTVGSAAAIANAVWHATGRRFQQLPITVDKLLSAPPSRKE